MAMTGGTAKLVKTTYPFSDKSKAVNLYIYYKSTQDVTTNKSTVSCGMYVTTPSGWDIGQWDDWNSASYVGTPNNTFNGTIPNFSGTRWIAENKTFTVDHNADGTGKATIQWKWAVNSPWGGYVNPSGSFSIDLPQIPRASTPTLSASSVQMGKAITISMSRASSAFTHTLKYTINGTTGTIASGLGTSYTWTVPKELVQHIPNNLSSAVTITCETYSGATKVGSKTVAFTATVPDASVPTVSASSTRMGGMVIITTNREASSYTHTLKYTLNGTTGTIASSVGASHTWTVPDLVALIPNATSGTATITCVTYNGTAAVGEKTVSIKINAYSATVPAITSELARMGDVATIGLNRKSSKYTHDLSYSIGTKSGTIGTGITLTSKSWSIPASLVSETPNATKGTVTITCVTKNGTATIGTETINIAVEVPEASTPSTNTIYGIMGESLVISTNRKASQYTHSLKYTFGGETVDMATGVEDSHTWNVPLILAAKIPSALSDLVTITCTTYNGTAAVGTKSYSISLSVPDNDLTKPNFTMAFTPVHSLPGAFDDVFVQGKSKVSVTFSASSEYADIKGYSYKIGSVTKSGNSAVSELLVTSGSIAVEGTVTDSRGYSRTITEYIDVSPYSKPKIVAYSGENNIICTRSFKNGTVDNTQVYVLIKASASYSKVVSGDTQHNFCRIHYRYKTASADDYTTDWVELQGTDVSHVIEDVFNVKTAYTLQLWVEDDVGEEQTYTYIIKALRTPLHLGERGENLGLGQFCDYDEPYRIDVGWKTYFNTGIGRKVIFEASSGWNKGEILNEVFTDADTMSIMEYTLFVALVEAPITSGGGVKPMLCLRNGEDIYSSFDSVSLQMHYFTSHNTMKLSTITDGYKVTALYALL